MGYSKGITANNNSILSNPSRSNKSQTAAALKIIAHIIPYFGAVDLTTGCPTSRTGQGNISQRRKLIGCSGDPTGLRAWITCSGALQFEKEPDRLSTCRLHVNRAKGGIEIVHPICGPELRALRPLQRHSPYVFVTEAGTPVTTAWFLRMVQRTGKAAKLPFHHPHMLRHSTGYKLANQGEDTRSLAHYLDHRNLQSTARYTALAPDRFRGFWKD
jgi:integrase